MKGLLKIGFPTVSGEGYPNSFDFSNLKRAFSALTVTQIPPYDDVSSRPIVNWTGRLLATYSDCLSV